MNMTGIITDNINSHFHGHSASASVAAWRHPTHVNTSHNSCY